MINSLDLSVFAIPGSFWNGGRNLRNQDAVSFVWCRVHFVRNMYGRPFFLQTAVWRSTGWAYINVCAQTVIPSKLSAIWDKRTFLPPSLPPFLPHLVVGCSFPLPLVVGSFVSPSLSFSWDLCFFFLRGATGSSARATLQRVSRSWHVVFQ